MFFKIAYIERVEDNQVLSGAADWQSVKPTDDVYYVCTMQILETLTQISRPKEALRINIICWLVGLLFDSVLPKKNKLQSDWFFGPSDNKTSGS